MSPTRSVVLIAVACAAIVIQGCTMAKISGRGEIPLILNQPQTKVETVQRFEHSKHIAFDYTSAFDVSEVLDDVLIGTEADAIINLTITVKTTFPDFALNLVTLGFAQAKTFQIKGAVIMADGKLVSAADLGIAAGDIEEESLNLRSVRQHAETRAIRVALTRSYGNISKAAELLGITRPTLYDLLNKYGMSAEGYGKKASGS